MHLSSKQNQWLGKSTAPLIDNFEQVLVWPVEWDTEGNAVEAGQGQAGWKGRSEIQEK